MKYCSSNCQKRDWKLHKILCSQFKHFQNEHRPSPDHRRVIFFPPDEDRPRFVWMKYAGSPKGMVQDYNDFEKYVSGTASILASFDSHRELGRQYDNTFRIMCLDFFVDKPVNKSIAPFLGPYAPRVRGPVMCMAPTKYREYLDRADLDEEDQEEEDEVCIPYDLDTTSLAVHVACLRFRAKYDGIWMYCINAQEVGDGYDPK